MIEHRRIDISGGFSDDTDWAGTHTLPTFGDDLAAGEIRPLTAVESRIIIFYELYDGVNDGASPVAPGLATLGLQSITAHRSRGKDVFDVGVAVNAPAQRREIEFEITKEGRTWIRVQNGASFGAAQAIWIFAIEDIEA